MSNPMTLAHLEALALAGTPAGGGDISPMLDACSPETVLALVAVARAAESCTGGDINLLPLHLRPLADAVAALKEVMR